MVKTLETTTFKSRKTELSEQCYGGAGRPRQGYPPHFDEYAVEVAAGKRPKG
ncbi:hypothetical protein [Mycobacterium paraense]|uniref:hypothetical protein n=1 Tax=Mycobacterium paraense TaxID=767916 RepID=UPI0014837D9B|nr:hypothetical protein [Mycobacterium paraense]